MLVSGDIYLGHCFGFGSVGQCDVAGTRVGNKITVGLLGVTCNGIPPSTIWIVPLNGFSAVYKKKQQTQFTNLQGFLDKFLGTLSCTKC